MKQMSLIEMDGFLKGKCIPRDLKVNETNAEYLVRKFAEAEAKISALSEDQQRAIESIKQADAAVKLAHEKFSELAAENAGLKAICDDRRRFIMNGVQMGYIKVPAAETDPDLETIRIAISPQKPIPATDAFLAEVRAQGVEMLAKNHQSIVNALKGDSLFSDGEYRHAAIVSAAVYFAAELRKGGNQ
ncbi:ead/Ea22-like family protein [Escherichia coli]|uniref:ead/Ea22-like family protein n=1 Tax=Escherichia coli TaxID=562 RepID=UPI000DD8C15C|nr:ead/Ea22-like family protein [Escherichia coli]EJZ2545255.1 ead/Ea22-like family protein [Escherichia coli]